MINFKSDMVAQCVASRVMAFESLLYTRSGEFACSFGFILQFKSLQMVKVTSLNYSHHFFSLLPETDLRVPATLY